MFPSVKMGVLKKGPGALKYLCQTLENVKYISDCFSVSHVTSHVNVSSCRYKEVCPYPDPTFTQVTKYLDVPETLLTDFTSGSTYHIEVGYTTHHSELSPRHFVAEFTQTQQLLNNETLMHRKAFLKGLYVCSTKFHRFIQCLHAQPSCTFMWTTLLMWLNTGNWSWLHY